MKFPRTLRFHRLLIPVFILILLFTLAACGEKENPAGDLDSTTSPQDSTEATEIIDETQPPTVPATMGTIITGKLHIRKEPGSNYDSVGSYLEGERVEILETKTVDDTVWGRTGKGWIGMGYVRMDGVAPENTEGDAQIDIESNGNFGILGYGVVDLGTLNVRSGPGTDYDKVTEVYEGIRYAYYEESGDWVRIDSGWVSVSFFYREGTVADDAANGTVTTDDLKIRTGPSTDFAHIGSYKTGDNVTILAQVDDWAYTEKGWISMNYVELAAPTYTTGTGTITSGLNIRKEPNADSEIVGTYQKGDPVSILEVKDGWGKTDQGWINMKYVKMD